MTDPQDIHVKARALKGCAYWPHPTKKGVGVIRFDASDGDQQFYYVNAAILRQLAEASLKNATSLEQQP